MKGFYRFAKLRFVTTLLAGLLSTISSAQNKEISRVIRAIEGTNDKIKLSDLYNQLANLQYSIDFDKGLESASEALRLASEANYRRGEAQALTSIGTYHYYNGDQTQSIAFYRQALAAVGGEKIAEYPVRTYLRLSILFRERAEFDSATNYLNKAEKILGNNDMTLLRASLLASRGLLLNAQARNRKAIPVLRASLAIRMKLKDSTRIAQGWRNLGLVYTYLSQYDSAEYCFNHAQPIVDRTHDQETEMLLNLSRGEATFARGEFTKASEIYMKALSAVKKNTYKRYHAIILLKIGELYENQGAYHTAYDYLFNALQEFEKINARQDMAQAISQIGWCYNYQDNFPKALENANQALAIAIQIGDSASIGQNHNLIGYTLYKTGKYKEALVHLEQAVFIRKKIGHWWGVSFTLYNMALTYFALGQDEKAFDLLLQSLVIDEQIGKKSGVAFTCNELGYRYSKRGDFAKASHYLSVANELARSIPIQPQLLINYKNYIFFNEQQKNSEGVIRYYRLYTSLKDSMGNEVNASRIAKADALFQLQKKAAEIELVNKENELNQEKVKTQQAEIAFQKSVIILGTVSLLVLSAAVVIIYRLFQSNKKAKEVLRAQNLEIQERKEEIQAQSEELIESNEKLHRVNMELSEKNREVEAQGERVKEVNAELEAINDQLEKRVEKRTSDLNKAYQELETFFYRTSHDFRRPLTTYLGLVEVAKTTVKDKQALDLFDKIKETTLGLDLMLLKLQSISNTESASDIRVINLKDLLTGCCEKYAPQMQAKGIKFQIAIAEETLTSNEYLLRSAIENLVENAVNFCTVVDPYLKISTTRTSNSVSLKFADNGQGIAEQFQGKIFSMYYRANDNSKGNGLGLYIARRAVEKLGGSISFQSVKNEGSTFEIRMPA